MNCIEKNYLTYHTGFCNQYSYHGVEIVTSVSFGFYWNTYLREICQNMKLFETVFSVFRSTINHIGFASFHKFLEFLTMLQSSLFHEYILFISFI